MDPSKVPQQYKLLPPGFIFPIGTTAPNVSTAITTQPMQDALMGDEYMKGYLAFNNLCQQLTSEVANVDALVRNLYQRSIAWSIGIIATSTYEKQTFLFSVEEGVMRNMKQIQDLLLGTSVAAHNFIQSLRQVSLQNSDQIGEVHSRVYDPVNIQEDLANTSSNQNTIEGDEQSEYIEKLHTATPSVGSSSNNSYEDFREQPVACKRDTQDEVASNKSVGRNYDFWSSDCSNELTDEAMDKSSRENISKSCSQGSYASALKVKAPKITQPQRLIPATPSFIDFKKIPDGDVVEFFWNRLTKKGQTSVTSLSGVVSTLPDGGRDFMQRIKSKYGSLHMFLMNNASHFYFQGEKVVGAKKVPSCLAPYVSQVNSEECDDGNVARPNKSVLSNCKDHSRLYHEWKKAGYVFDLELFQNAEFRKQYVKATGSFEKERMESVFQFLSKIFKYRNLMKQARCFISLGCGPCADLEGIKDHFQSSQGHNHQAVFVGYDIVNWSQQIGNSKGITFIQGDVTLPNFLDDASFPPDGISRSTSVIVISYLASAIKLYDNLWWETVKKRCSLLVVIDVNDAYLNNYLNLKGFTKYDFGTYRTPIHVYP